MKGYTIAEVKSWGVCYSQERLEELYAGRETLTALDCFCLDIPEEDKLFVLLRPEVIPERELHLLACDFAGRVLHLAKDSRSSEAIRIKRLWIEGKATDEELRAAQAAGEAAEAAAEAVEEAWTEWAARVAWAAEAWEAWAARESVTWAAAAWSARAAAEAAAEAAARPARSAAMWAAEARAASAWEASARGKAAWCSAVRAERKAQLDLVREVVERLNSNAEDGSLGAREEPSFASLS